MNRLKPFDILLLGQLIVDFHGEQVGSTLNKMMSYRPSAGGIANLAFAFSRLGSNTALCSEIGDDPIGEFLQEKLSHEKIGLTNVVINTNLSTSLALVGNERSSYHSAPLSEKVHLERGFTMKSQVLFLTSDLFLAENGQRLAKEAQQSAKQHQCRIVLVLEKHHPVPQSLLPLCALIFIKDPEDAFGTLKQIREISNAPLILMKKGSYAIYTETIPDQWQASLQHHPESHEIAEVAFVAGFTNAWLQGHPSAECLTQGESCFNLTHNRPNNSSSLPTQAELTFYLSQKKGSFASFTQWNYLQHLHHASTQPQTKNPYLVFNIGSLAQWLTWGKVHFTQDEARLSSVFSFIVQTLSTLPPFILMTDESELSPAMLNFSQMIRTLDVPEVFPLQFKNDPDVRGTLIGWPQNHHAKITLQYHPDDPFALRKQQESALAFLYRAVCATQHDLWVEIVAPTNSLITSGTLSHIIRRFYEIGIYPTIWQMTPPRDQRSWDSIERVIAENSPFCQGVVVSAQNILNAQLPLLLQSVTQQKYAKGFVLNRSVLQPLLEAFFAEKIDEDTFREQMIAQFTAIAALWKKETAKPSQQAILFPV